MTECTWKEEKRNRAVLVGLNAYSLSAEDNATETTLEELAALLETAGGECVGVVLQNKDKPDARTFIGEGKVDEVRELAQAVEADLVVFDNEISPAQVRVLTEDIGIQVMDRAGLILDIFAQRARTKEGRLQVALAQYKYLLPRLTGMWGHLVRQTASGGKSPIGTRGPGETQLETDRRHIRRKIQKLEEDLKDVRRVRAVQRDRRIKNEVPVVAIVGYTNAGKSTLLNMLGGLDTPTEGSIQVGGTDLTQLTGEQATIFRRKKIGFVFQNYNLIPVLTVWENIVFPLALDGQKPDRAFIMEVVRLLGLERKLDSLPGNLSGGQQQRVAIARALASKPAILLADEPTGNLDSKTSEDVIALLKTTSQTFHQTIVMITHNPEIAAKADVQVRIEDGKIHR